MITEDQLEQICLDWFRDQGYTYAYGPDIAFDGDTPERRDYQQVVLSGRLLTALQKINPHIPLATLEEAAQTLSKPESPVLIHNNRAFHKLLLEGVPVEYRDGDEIKADHVQLIDFHGVEKNQFLVVSKDSGPRKVADLPAIIRKRKASSRLIARFPRQKLRDSRV